LLSKSANLRTSVILNLSLIALALLTGPA
jgi:hypothetical protein